MIDTKARAWPWKRKRPPRAKIKKKMRGTNYKRGRIWTNKSARRSLGNLAKHLGMSFNALVRKLQ